MFEKTFLHTNTHTIHTTHFRVHSTKKKKKLHLLLSKTKKKHFAELFLISKNQNFSGCLILIFKKISHSHTFNSIPVTANHLSCQKNSTISNVATLYLFDRPYCNFQ